MTRRIEIPELALVLLIGISGSGKSTFATRHFLGTEVISSDTARGLVSDDENDQSATADAFDVVHYLAGKRLARGKIAVIDATNIQPAARQSLVAVAREHDVLPVAIIFDVPEKTCVERNQVREDRDFGAEVIKRQAATMRRHLKGLGREGIRVTHTLTAGEIDDVEVVRTKLYNDLRHESGPFDVIGDVHGCRAELETLLETLGYAISRDGEGRAIDAAHPDGRRAILVGDLVDRGPDTPGVLRLAMGMVRAGHALVVSGNHEAKLVRALSRKDVTVSHGLQGSLDQLAQQPEEFVAEVREWMDGLISHYVLDGGRLVVSHAGLIEKYHGRASGRVRAFCLYGDTTGETDEYGLPVRYPWANEYRGKAMVLYGHTPVPTAEWINNTMCLDTGCVFGGSLTALRYPEREVVSVPAERMYYEPARPLVEPVDEREPGLLDIDDVLGTSGVDTALAGRVSVRPENAAPALEVMSRFAVAPSWLMYLPPTMAPVEASAVDGVLEHPAEAFAAFRKHKVERVVCEEKHMGSRAVVVIARDLEAARRRFDERGERTGVVYTRTGREFFAGELGAELVRRITTAVERAGLFDELGTDWLALDAELLPWSAKAQGLLRAQYAQVGAAARASMPVALNALDAASARGVDVAALRERFASRDANAQRFVDAYRRYCWPVDGLDGAQLAVFQVLASEGRTFGEREHAWHMDVADRLVAANGELFRTTRRTYASLDSEEECAAATAWWEELTGAGGEGMVVKPALNLDTSRAQPTQPGLKVRGPEYLRIIYGPDYLEADHLATLKRRTVGRKRSLASREYALGIEGLRRAAAGEPLWRVHECAFAVLALESEPMDPRL
ncbi:polynucleotide kinase-phosphatase [Demequina sp. TTPB684]|uniref:polynucleotide kinase-phosphatase n=1 Tax=unclassified Demequina TaxID=2620311 RepID=UPI001CF18254|nr:MULTISPECIES: polynucleotide kinase-phosphatase [unclassified Demequina]MCB2412411.1 polynucleotide kinase-phosphatase [Demequina sp. TTPB684]UPU89505.1 polynucleotide kinase-phosphatase [Demequina sp. TMPB413]